MRKSAASRIRWLTEGEDHDHTTAESRRGVLPADHSSGSHGAHHGGQAAQIAEGYHRLRAIYGFDEDALIPCKII